MFHSHTHTAHRIHNIKIALKFQFKTVANSVHYLLFVVINFEIRKCSVSERKFRSNNIRFHINIISTPIKYLCSTR